MAVKSSFKNMSLCLFVICLVCSSLLAGFYALTKAPIDAAAMAKNQAAIMEVLPESTVSVEETRTIDVDGKSYTYNLGYDEKGEVTGCAINVSTLGFGGLIEIKVGFFNDGVICNTKVLSQAETPGLGAKCVEASFSGQFKGFNPSEKKLAVKKDGGDVDAITASTITSRAYAEGLASAARVLTAIAGTPMLIDSSTGATSASDTSVTSSDSSSVTSCESSSVISSDSSSVISSESSSVISSESRNL